MIAIIFFLVTLLSSMVQAIELGQGHLSQKDLSTPICVEGALGYRGIQEGKVKLDHQYSSFREMTRTAFRSSAGVDLGIIGAKGETHVSQVVLRNHKSWYLMLSAEVKNKVQAFQSFHWSKYGKEVRRFADQASFLDLCGDEFAVEIVRGRKVWIVLRYTFKERINEATFKAKIKVKILGIGVSKTITHSTSARNELEDFSASIIVSGEKTEELESRFRQSFTPCSSEDMDACLENANKAIGIVNSQKFLEMSGAMNGAPIKVNYKKYEDVLIGLD